MELQQQKLSLWTGKVRTYLFEEEARGGKKKATLKDPIPYLETLILKTVILHVIREQGDWKEFITK